MRQAAVGWKPREAEFQSFPAPIGGWIANVSLATPGARRPDGSKVNGAARLENWFCTATSIRMRGGSQKYATIGDGTLDATALFTYINGANLKLFGATETGIYDISTVADADVTPSADVGSLTGGDWSVVQFATSGGTFLRAVNGIDTPRVYDGSTWDTLPTITGATPTTLSYVWAFKERLFFIQSGTLDAWYLAVGTIGGAATKLPLGGVFSRGGSLMFGASWSLDTGAGLNEQCAFVTTEGEVAVYQGTDPSSSTTWSKVGVYRIGRPRGPKAVIRAGGDLIIATDIGFVPLSQAIQRDFAALAPAAVSYPIEDAWNEAVAARSFANWHCEVWPTKQMVVVALPSQATDDPMMFVANARTGGWSPFTGWDGKCLALFGDRLFYGTSDGKVIEAETTGADDGTPYTAVCVPLFDPLKSPASLKTGLMARAVLRAPSQVTPQMSLQTDFNIVLPVAPDDETTLSGSLWGTAVWGESVWGTPPTKTTFQQWQSINGAGYSLSPATQITSGSVAAPNVELVQTDLQYDIGEIGS